MTYIFKILDIFRKPTVLQAKTVGSYEFKYYQYDTAQNIEEYLFRHAFENELTDLEAMSQNSMLKLQPNLEKYKKEDRYWDLSAKRENICQNIAEKFKSKDKVICKQIIARTLESLSHATSPFQKIKCPAKVAIQDE